jgi:formylglycine-generating enzyme required for sulfatase activity
MQILCVPLLLAATILTAPDQDRAILARCRDEFLRVEPGKPGFPAEFVQGRSGGGAAEGPPHNVRMPRPFSIAQYEVTQELWQAVMGANPSRWKGPRNSVERVSFDEAQNFCRQLTERLRAAGLIGPRQLVRLPTESEWEYAARAGTATLYSFGDDPAQLDDYGWHTGNAAGNDPPVGAKRANPWGLHDVHGYLEEWCLDPWHADYSGAPVDGASWEKDADGERRVVRGGSWKSTAAACSSSARRGLDRDTRDDAVGLRCVLVDEPE